MKSRQINFFIKSDELSKFNKYLAAQKWLIVNSKSIDGQPRILDSVCKINTDESLLVYLVPEQFLETLIFRFVEKQNHYVLNSEIDLPVINFMRPFESPEENYIRRGKLYYILGYFNTEKEFTLKPDEFLKAADKLFKAFRRTFKNQKPNPYKGFIITAQTQQLVAEQGLELKQV